MGKDADVQPAFTTNVLLSRDTSGFDRLRFDPTAVKRLQQANVNLRGILFNDIYVQSQRYGAGKYSYQYTYKKEKKEA